jgi:hypothetical protein
VSRVDANLKLAVIGNIGLGITSQEEFDAGAEPEVELHVPVGIPIPVTPTQAIGAPLGVLALALSKDEAQEFFSEGLKAVEKLPEPKPKTDILTASNLNQVREMAEEMKKVTGT